MQETGMSFLPLEGNRLSLHVDFEAVE